MSFYISIRVWKYIFDGLCSGAYKLVSFTADGAEEVATK